VKEFLSQRAVSYIDRNVAEDPQALAELERLGYLTTPVITVDGHVVVGFDRRKLEQLITGLS